MGFVIELSKLKIGIMSDSDYIKRRCADYITSGVPDFTVAVTHEQIENERKLSAGFSDEYYEYVCTYRNICMKMPEYDRILVHSAVIEVGGRGYAFAARSGVGKTTHIRLWREAFDDVSIINGDKPILRYDGNSFFACGTPWCGKEGYNLNKEVKLNAFVFLERGEENSIAETEPKSNAERLFKQIIIPKDALGASKTLEICDKILKNVPMFELYCNKDVSAALCARNELDKI